MIRGRFTQEEVTTAETLSALSSEENGSRASRARPAHGAPNEYEDEGRAAWRSARPSLTAYNYVLVLLGYCLHLGFSGRDAVDVNGAVVHLMAGYFYFHAEIVCAHGILIMNLVDGFGLGVYEDVRSSLILDALLSARFVFCGHALGATMIVADPAGPGHGFFVGGNSGDIRGHCAYKSENR
jgi:hypothetical protein